jgi:sugar phosphate isomerase/epimerase
MLKLCFDATRFGFGLQDAVEMAAERGLSAIEYSFESFPVTSKAARKLDDQEKQYLQSVALRSKELSIEIACLKLNDPLEVTDKSSVKNFHGMVEKLLLVANEVGCRKLLFYLDPSPNEQWKEQVEQTLEPTLSAARKAGIKMMLSLSTPPCYRGRSLKFWRATEPGEWRDFLATMPDLALSFSVADCLWQSIDYLRIVPGLVSAMEHIEARDVEVNRMLLHDTGMYGPLWWRYKQLGRGQVDWKQFIEALKLYDFKGAISIQLDDEFTPDGFEDLSEALDGSVKLLKPLLMY